MNTNIPFGLLIAIVACFAASLEAQTQEPQKPKPNVILILTDDLGWQDVKCYDIDDPSPMDTPNLDTFAKRGVMFWQAYSPAPTCSPSRCAIMSGNHPARAQKTHVVGGAPPRARSDRSRMMDPWYSGRMPADEMTLAKALKRNGYVTGHAGKWHIAINHGAFPQPKDVGFDYTRSSRGAHRKMPDRMSGFATDAADDPFRLDSNGYPFHQNSEDALTFLRDYKDKPFFLYYATWLVHGPIMTRSESLLNKYVDRLQVDPLKPNGTEIPGQLNPFYAAMVETLDYHVGNIVRYLDETDDPRWPGHKLSENTYVIFTSDNGGMEGGSERYTDNNPLDRGKISAKEGGTRVPLMIAGPGVPSGVQSDVMVNGLDFYPTILKLTGTEVPKGKPLDGDDISGLLLGDPTDANLVKNSDGSVRDTMVWHFPHGSALESTIRVGDYKLIRNYDHVLVPDVPELELFRLYETDGKTQTRVDIEEAKNIADSMPEKTAAMNAELTKRLTEMKASYPSYNPNYQGDLPGKDQVCSVTAHQRKGNTVEFTYRENGSKVVRADLIYTLNGGDRYEEWFRKTKLISGADDSDQPREIAIELPEGTTHYVLDLIDENNFLVSYPAISRKGQPSASALSATGEANAVPPAKADVDVDADASTATTEKDAAFDEKDTNQDQKISKQEFLSHYGSKFDRKDKNKDDLLSSAEHSHQSFAQADENQDGNLTRDEFASIFERQFEKRDKDGDGFISPNE